MRQGPGHPACDDHTFKSALQGSSLLMLGCPLSGTGVNVNAHKVSNHGGVGHRINLAFWNYGDGRGIGNGGKGLGNDGR